MVRCIGIYFTFCVGLITSKKMGMILSLVPRAWFPMTFPPRRGVFFARSIRVHTRVFVLRMVVGIEIQIAVGVYSYSVNRNGDRSTITTRQEDGSIAFPVYRKATHTALFCK